MTTDDGCAWLSASAMAAAIRTGELSVAELVAACLDRIDRVNPLINAIATLAEQAGEQACQADRQIARGATLGRLHGVPFTVKDTFDTRGIRTMRGSQVFRNHTPDVDAAAVRRLRAAGAILLGKTNTPEFTLWTETDNLVSGRTANPWSMSRSAGGSSGGDAAAVAAGMTPIGLGSDLSGSIRLPAGYCGVVGFKPSHGAIPLEGHYPRILPEFCHVGPLTRTVNDARLVYSVLSDSKDAPPEAFSSRRRPLKVGVLDGDCFGSIDEAVTVALQTAVGRLAGQGLEVGALDRSNVDLTGLVDLSLILFARQSAEFLATFSKEQVAELHPILRARLSRELPPTATENLARAELGAMVSAVDRLLDRYDILMAPVSPTAAPVSGAEYVVAGTPSDPRRALAATLPFSLGGYPAISVPVTVTSDGLPVGVQFIGRRGQDYRLLETAALIEESTQMSGPRL